MIKKKTTSIFADFKISLTYSQIIRKKRLSIESGIMLKNIKKCF